MTAVRILALVFFIIGMILLWFWANFIAYGPTGPRWEFVILTAIVIGGLALWFDRRDAKAD